MPSKGQPGHATLASLQLALASQGTLLRGTGRWERRESLRDGAHVLVFTQHPLALTRTYLPAGVP